MIRWCVVDKLLCIRIFATLGCNCHTAKDCKRRFSLANRRA